MAAAAALHATNIEPTTNRMNASQLVIHDAVAAATESCELR